MVLYVDHLDKLRRFKNCCTLLNQPSTFRNELCMLIAHVVLFVHQDTILFPIYSSHHSTDAGVGCEIVCIALLHSDVRQLRTQATAAPFETDKLI